MTPRELQEQQQKRESQQSVSPPAASMGRKQSVTPRALSQLERRESQAAVSPPLGQPGRRPSMSPRRPSPVESMRNFSPSRRLIGPVFSDQLLLTRMRSTARSHAETEKEELKKMRKNVQSPVPTPKDGRQVAADGGDDAAAAEQGGRKLSLEAAAGNLSKLEGRKVSITPRQAAEQGVGGKPQLQQKKATDAKKGPAAVARDAKTPPKGRRRGSTERGGPWDGGEKDDAVDEPLLGDMGGGAGGLLATSGGGGVTSRTVSLMVLALTAGGLSYVMLCEATHC